MLPDRDMLKGMGGISVEHGKMIKNGNAMFKDIISGKYMMYMHMDGTTPESHALMKYALKLAEDQLQDLMLLDEMPAAAK